MLRPLEDYIVVKPLEREHSKVIEVISNEKHCRGEVLAVGPGKPNKKGHIMPLDVQVGEIVAFGDGNFDFYPKHYAMDTNGVSNCYRIIQEQDVCFVEEENTFSSKELALDMNDFPPGGWKNAA